MIGSKIANFQIVEELGSGGMGTVYKARDLNLKRFVAIKVLNPGLLNKDNNYKRFKNEAEISAQINHPNVATLYNFLEIDGHAYIIMEYVNGMTLEELIDEKGPLNRQQGIDIAIQILKGISAAHQLNILHRDLKPANIMISRNGYVKIMDFGIALMENSTRLTTQNKVIGTLYYMAPELFSGTLPSVGSDLYAVGVMFFEMLTGKSLFEADSEAALMYQILHEKPQLRLKANKHNLTPVLKKLVQKTTSKRYLDALTVVGILEENKQSQKPISKIELPDLKPALRKIKRRFRIKTNFAKQANIVSVSTTEKANFNILNFVNQRFLLICLVLTTVIIIVSASINSRSPEITSGNYIAEDLGNLNVELDNGKSNLSLENLKFTEYKVGPPSDLPEKPSDYRIDKKKEDNKKAIAKVKNETEILREENDAIEPSEEKPESATEKIQETKDIKEKVAPIIETNEDDEIPSVEKNDIKIEAIADKKPIDIFLRERRISLRFTNTINSSNFKIGQDFLLETDQEITIDGIIIIPKHAQVKAVVTKNRASNSGKVTFGIKFNQIQAINGEWVDLKYPEYSDIQKGEVIFEKGRVVKRVTLQSKKLIILR